MSYSNFFEQEFANVDLNDKRLDRRAASIGNNLVRSPGSCIQEVFATKNSTRCAYDFFINPKDIYVIQDSTFYNYTNHKAKIDVENIGKQHHHTQFGFIQHTALCISAQDIPLGILELDFIGYEDEIKSFPYRQGFPQIASSRWRRFLSESIAKLKGIDKDVIMLCDKEADFFELLNDLHESKFKYVISCKWDRPTGKSARAKKNKFSSLLQNAPVLGEIPLLTINSNTHEEKEEIFYLKTLEDVMLPPVDRGAGHKQNTLAPIMLNLVEVFNQESKCLLLTNLPVKTLSNAMFVVQSYKRRWHIESLHKVLKTAYSSLNKFTCTVQEMLSKIF